MEEDLFPSQMMLSSRRELEEERRLFYVAITRAKQKIALSYAITRYRFGRLKSCEPSRFLEEIDPSYVMINKKLGSFEPIIGSGASSWSNTRRNNNETHYNGLGLNKPNNNLRKNTTQAAYKPSADFAPSDTTNLEVGMKVEHPKFGFGVVKGLDIQGANRKATVNFNSFGEKTLLLSFAKLKVHE
jgi:DNA helicase-2/ATP-dependent DNA helicase PcrA